MAERKLNFNAPLLSTRRMHKTAVSVRRNKTNKFTTDDDSSSSSVQVLVPEIGLEQVTEAASVPFTWEQAPGRLKENDFRPHEVCDSKQQAFTPCLPPGKATVEKAVDGNTTRFQSKHVEEESEDEDDVFSDARDTLNHSVSGYGGVVTKKKPLTLSEDSLSRDFMLNRFLPAAKAMAVEQPHYASNRKPSTFMSEPTIQVRDLVPEEKRPTPNRCDESAIVPYYHYHQDIDDDDDEESEEEDDDDDDGKDDQVSEYAYLSKRGCGMLPQLCFKESLGMMSALVPGFKAKHNSPVTSPSHDQVKSSKASQLKSKFQSAKKLALYSVSKHKLGGKVQSPVHESVGKKHNSESNLSVACRSSSPYRHSRCMFAETRKETENLRANRLNKHIRNISTSQESLYPKTSNCSTISLLEKTVSVDDTESFPIIYDVVISPEEEDKAEEKPDANLALVAFENMSMVDGDDELGKINNGPLLAPPSPKRPSESWLLHNLPSVTSQILPSRSRRYHPFHPQKQDPKENSRNAVTKWETIVKTSHMHRDHFRYSEELVAHTSHQ